MPDTFAPDVGQRVDPAGRVTYDFDAHLHARGLDLDASEVSSPLSDREVRWLRTADGAVVAEIFAYTDSYPAAGLDLRANRYDGLGGRHSSGITAQTDPSGGFVDVYAESALNRATVIDAAGNSSFLRHSLGTLGLLKIGGVYQVDSGPLNLNAFSFVTLAHNLGRTVYPLASREDAFASVAVDINWQYTTIDANQIAFAFRNEGPVNGAQARFNVFLVTLT